MIAINIKEVHIWRKKMKQNVSMWRGVMKMISRLTVNEIVELMCCTTLQLTSENYSGSWSHGSAHGNQSVDYFVFIKHLFLH